MPHSPRFCVRVWYLTYVTTRRRLHVSLSLFLSSSLPLSLVQSFACLFFRFLTVIALNALLLERRCLCREENSCFINLTTESSLGMSSRFGGVFNVTMGNLSCGSLSPDGGGGVSGAPLPSAIVAPNQAGARSKGVGGARGGDVRGEPIIANHPNHRAYPNRYVFPRAQSSSKRSQQCWQYNRDFRIYMCDILRKSDPHRTFPDAATRKHGG